MTQAYFMLCIYLTLAFLSLAASQAAPNVFESLQTALPRIPLVEFHAAGVINGQMCFFGGFNAYAVPQNTTACYNYASQAWTVVDSSASPPALAAPAFTAFNTNDTLYLFGGITGLSLCCFWAYIGRNCREHRLLVRALAPQLKFGVDTDHSRSRCHLAFSSLGLFSVVH